MANLLFHPAFKRKSDAIIKDLLGHGLSTVIASGYRSPEEQARLYAVGRYQPNSNVVISGLKIKVPSKSQYPNWKIVTKAKPFKSAHQWGIACDFAWIVNGKLQYEAGSSWWKLLYSSAKAHECEDITKSIPWDRGHIQWKIAWSTIKDHMNEFMQLYQKFSIKECWKRLDKYLA